LYQDWDYSDLSGKEIHLPKIRKETGLESRCDHCKVSSFAFVDSFADSFAFVFADSFAFADADAFAFADSFADADANNFELG
jgi:hypothetical protein